MVKLFKGVIFAYLQHNTYCVGFYRILLKIYRIDNLERESRDG